MDGADDRVEQLLAAVGGILEDASVVAILGVGLTAQQRVDALRGKFRKATALLDRAAAVIEGHRPPES
ncbi:hypothetical protein AB5I41_10635 [Sphingomonas sp. MMS24-JH45]